MDAKRYALVIGIAEYFPPYENLEYPAHDAEQVARVLEQHGQFEVERLPKRLNPDTGRDEVVQKELTGDELGDALNQFLLEKAKGSDALIYYSGHGITVPNKVGRNKGYLVTSDCASGTVWRDGIALDDFNDLISEADLKSLVVLLDCCHAGYFLENNLIRQTLNIFSRKTDCFLIAACRSNEKSYEGGSYGGEHGVFTNALLEGLSQENAGDDGKIRTDELFSFISKKLEHRNKNIPFKPQEAIRISSGGSLTLVSYPPKPKRSAILQQEAEATLKEKAARVLDLLPTKPLEGLVLAIQATELSLEKLHGEVHSALYASLHRAIEIAREQNFFIGHILKDYAFSITSVAFSPDGQYIVSGSKHGIRLRDLKGNLITNAFLGHKNWVNCVAFSPNGQYIVSGGDDETVRLWDLKGNQIGQPFRGHNANVTAVAFSPDNHCIVSGGQDGMVRLWNLQGKQIISPLHGLQDWISCVTFSPDGQYIAACGEDEYQCIKLWNRKDYQLSNSFQACGWIGSIAFSPDSQYLISGGFDDSLQLWNLEGHPIGEPFQGHENVVTSVAFSPDGKYIVSGSRDKTIRLWDLEGNTFNDPFGEHKEEVNSVAFSPDGKCIVSGSDDCTLRLWDVQPLPGNDWETLLQVACNRLRYHPVFKNPQTEVEKQACETCRKYVWDK